MFVYIIRSCIIVCLGMSDTESEFCQMLENRFADETTGHSDIHTGEHYQTTATDRPTKWHMSFVMNTDGVDVFNVPGSGKMWPVYLAINELPPLKRWAST